MDCLFCKIVNGEIPSFKIYEDDYTFAFLDINPNSNGHTLIIPKKHFNDMDDIDLETLSHINNAAKKVKKLLEEKLNCDGMIIQQNNGSVQEVKHYHMHLKPCYDGKTAVELITHDECIDNPKNIFEQIKND